jgi:nuclear transport factor 2 (NTF2) superfamily protein
VKTSGPRPPAAPDGVALTRLRSAIRAEHRIGIDYADETEQHSSRCVWPIVLTFCDRIRLLAAWCELRQAFRSFHVDRIVAMRETGERYPSGGEPCSKHGAKPMVSSAMRHEHADRNCHTARLVSSRRDRAARGKAMASVSKTVDGLTVHEAERLLAHYQAIVGSGDIAQILETFTPDVVVRFADFPEMHGRPELERFMAARFVRQKNYRLAKELRVVSNNVIVCSWDGTWVDGKDGRAMQGRGIELLTMQGGKIAAWDVVFNVWEQGAGASLPIV